MQTHAGFTGEHLDLALFSDSLCMFSHSTTVVEGSSFSNYSLVLCCTLLLKCIKVLNKVLAYMHIGFIII